MFGLLHNYMFGLLHNGHHNCVVVYLSCVLIMWNTFLATRSVIMLHIHDWQSQSGGFSHGGPIFLLTWHGMEKVIDCCFQTISCTCRCNMGRASSWVKCVHIALEWHLLDLPDEYKQLPPTFVLLMCECSPLPAVNSWTYKLKFAFHCA